MIFAIDPGSDKTGTAVVKDDGSLVIKAIVPTPDLLSYVGETYEKYPFPISLWGMGRTISICSPWLSSGLPTAAMPSRFTHR